VGNGAAADAEGLAGFGDMVDSTLIDTQNFANRPGGLDFMEVRTILPLWTKKMNALRVSASVSYNLSELDFNGFHGLQRETLHTLEAQVSLFWRPEQSKWWGLGFFTPGLGTDFQGLSWDDFEVSGLGLLGYRFTDSFSLAGGFFAQYGAQEGMIVPALGFIWKPDPFIVQVTPPFVVLGWRATESTPPAHGGAESEATQPTAPAARASDHTSRPLTLESASCAPWWERTSRDRGACGRGGFCRL
jgi:hypothetical protein